MKQVKTCWIKKSKKLKIKKLEYYNQEKESEARFGQSHDIQKQSNESPVWIKRFG